VVEPWAALGTELLVDLPGVRCWQERVEPGRSRPLHTHRHPWVTVVVSGAEGVSTDAEGRVIVSGRVDAGTVRYNDASVLPFTHSLTNTSDETLVMVAVELREPPAARAADTPSERGPG
jgi:oxalate decarboxylase/phosphoglucose isomerase-like protein (cupin superfamily)